MNNFNKLKQIDGQIHNTFNFNKNVFYNFLKNVSLLTVFTHTNFLCLARQAEAAVNGFKKKSHNNYKHCRFAYIHTDI